MPISVTCSCGKEFTFPDELAGKRGKCKACGQPIVIPDSRLPKVIESRVIDIPVATPLLIPQPLSNPPAVAHQALTPAVPATTACPFCAEPILVAAKKCKHCGEIVDPVLRISLSKKEVEKPEKKPKKGRRESPSPTQVTQVVVNNVVGGYIVEKKRGCGCGCLIAIILGVILYALMQPAMKGAREAAERAKEKAANPPVIAPAEKPAEKPAEPESKVEPESQEESPKARAERERQRTIELRKEYKQGLQNFQRAK